MFLGGLSTANEHEARKKKGGKKVQFHFFIISTKCAAYGMLFIIETKRR